jgi:GNAT superfamily N-acetyltransferase
VRSKAHWGYDDAFMKMSRASLTVSDVDIAAGRVLVAERQGLLFGVAKVEADGELGMLFVDSRALNRGVGRLLFDAAAALARRLGARRMTILADPNAAPFYARMGARFVSHAPSDAIPGRTLPLYEYDLTNKETP